MPALADAAGLAEGLGRIAFRLEHLSVRPLGSEEGFLLEASRPAAPDLARFAVRSLTSWPAAETLLEGCAGALRRAADLFRRAPAATVHPVTRSIVS